MSGYDQALFIQKLRQRASYGPLDTNRQHPVVTEQQIEDVSWEVMWDLELAIHQQKPEAMEKARQMLRSELLPRIIATVENEGFEVI